MSVGTVVAWHSEEGWGVIESNDTPGGWAYCSHLSSDELPELSPGQSQVIGGGFRGAVVGETVDFEWERAQQDGPCLQGDQRATTP